MFTCSVFVIQVNYGNGTSLKVIRREESRLIFTYALFFPPSFHSVLFKHSRYFKHSTGLVLVYTNMDIYAFVSSTLW